MFPSTPSHYICNGGLGDAVAASPVVKYAIENYHKDGKYLVSTVPAYRDIFWFVPDQNFNSIFEKYEFKEEYRHARTHPPDKYDVPRSNLSKVASFNLLNQVLDEKDYSYPLYPSNINVDEFGIDFSKAVVILVGYRSNIRKWNKQTLQTVVEWISANNYIPVLIGSESEPFDITTKRTTLAEEDKNKVLDTASIPQCINLVNKTTIQELIGIFQTARCLIGYDGGPIHLAGVTNIQIICAYTYTNPSSRMFARNNQFGWNMFPVTVSNDKCRFCLTDWHLFNYRFDNCWTGTLECCDIKPEQFINELKKVL